MHMDRLEDSAYGREKLGKQLLVFCEDMRFQCRKMCSLTEAAQDYADPSGRASLENVADMARKIEAVLPRLEDLADTARKQAEELREWVFTPPRKPEGNGDL